MQKRIATVLLAFTMLFLSLAVPGAAAEPVSLYSIEDASLLALGDGAVTISADGSYKVEAGTYTNGIAVAAGVTATLYLENVAITTTGASPIKVESGAALTLHVSGTNTLTAPSYYAGIAVLAEDTVTNYGTLTIDGDGTLNAICSGKNAAGIGGCRASNGSSVVGKIVINSGTINATGGAGTGGAGIGAGYNCTDLNEIIINGGIITAIGGNDGAGIGGVARCPSGKIEINGGFISATSEKLAYDIGPGASSQSNSGTITINGGSINAVFSEKTVPVDKYGSTLTQIVLTMPAEAGAAGKAVTVDDWETVTDAEGKLYLYVPASATSVSVQYEEKIYYAALSDGTTEYTLIKYEGGACTCAQDTTSIAFDLPETVTVNALAQQTRLKLATTFVHAKNCTFPIHEMTVTYSLSMKAEGTEGGEAAAQAADFSTVAEIDGEYLVAYYTGAGETVSVTASAGMGAFTYSQTKDITIVGDNTSRFDISAGNIDITADSSDSTKLVVKQGSNTYSVLASATVYIYQTAPTTDYVMTVKGTKARIALESVNIQTITYNVLTLGAAEGVDVTLELIGENTFYAQNTSAIMGVTSESTLTIEGTGSLNVTSGVGAGIGNIKSLTVNSGIVTARGGSEGAGIGGGKDGRGCTVVVNGGRVYAYGAGNAAGIGGGASTTAGAGGDFTINGGLVVAESGANGSGIGYGGLTSTPGTVTVNGGSVKATLGKRPNNGTNQYLVKLSIESIITQTDVTYSVGDDPATKIATSTDAEGKLYLHLNAGEQWIRVYKDGKVYYSYITVSANDSNTATAILSAECMLEEMTIAGQIGDTVIHEEDREVYITVPHNIVLTHVTPRAEFSAAFADHAGETLDFSADKTATFTLIGHDKGKKNYKIILTVADAPETPQADRYDIGKGAVTIYGDQVRYGGTRYGVNELGYTIYGSTTENVLAVDYSADALPPVTLENLSINVSAGTIPLRVSSSVNVTVSGICTLKSAAGNVISLDNQYGHADGVNLTVTGSGRLTVESTGSSSAVALGGRATSMTATGVTTSILAPDGVGALSGSGTFTTDSETYMRISNPGTVQPRNSEGTALYQLKAEVDAEDKSATTCEYEGKTYYVGTDATLYLMMPNGSHGMNVSYNGKEYQARPTINGAATACKLQIVEVTGVTYNTLINYQEQAVPFTVQGNNVIDNVLVRITPDDKALPVLEAVAGNVNGEAVANITVPENLSHEKDINYTVSYVVKNEVVLSRKLVQTKNNTSCDIEAFSIAGQISSVITESETLGNIIQVNMPYDHVFQQRYTAETITHTGGAVVPGAGDPVVFTVDASGNYARANYTVTAKDNVTTKTYQVRIFKEATPQITALSFTNPATADGGVVRVTARGTALGNIARAETEANRAVYIYSDDGIARTKAEPVLENGVWTYVAEITVPANTSDTESALHVLKAVIGDAEQTSINASLATVTVPRQKRGKTDIKNFTVDNQVGETVISIADATVDVTMPYDAELTDIWPSVVLEDLYATYAPVTSVDFTSPVEYTITAENGVDQKVYTVTLTKQNKPAATGVTFTSPQYSGAGRVVVTVSGSDLENAAYAINHSTEIVVSAALASGDETDSAVTPAVATRNADGSFTATLLVPSNAHDTIREYTISVTIGGEAQTLSGDVTLTVPAREANSKDLTDIMVADGQTEPIWGANNTIYLYVPYNTDLTSVVPVINHSGMSYAPAEAQDFSNSEFVPIEYTVTAEDSTTNVYQIKVGRYSSPTIDSIAIDQPETFNDTEVTIEIEGLFVPNEPVMDEVKLWVVGADGSRIDGTVTPDAEAYGGKAVATVSLPENDSPNDVVYTVEMTINDHSQDWGLNKIITVPARKARTITDFLVNGQIGSAHITEDDENGNTIVFTMPYATDLTALTPVITVNGDSYSEEGPQNFDEPVTYTVSAKNDTDRTYTVTALRDGIPSIDTVVITEPPTFKDPVASLTIEGTFFHSLAVRAIPADGGDPIEGTVVMNQRHKATATIALPTNLDTTDTANYLLEFDLDGFEDIENPSDNLIVVPRRKTREIKNFMVGSNQFGAARITETDIYVEVVYDTDIGQLSPTLSVDGDSFTPTGIVDFDNETKSVVYTVSAADDEDRNYTVHIARNGIPSITSVNYSEPRDYRGGDVVINFAGVFFEDAEVSAILDGTGEEIHGVINVFQDRRASAVINFPTNYDMENDKTYQLRFVVDGYVTPYLGGAEITVPRRTTREITNFALPADIQEGETRMEGTSIYVNVPYHLDITSVVPSFDYDAHSISPAADAALDFSDLNNPVRYTLSSSGDEDITYVVYVTRLGKDPKLLSLLVDGQLEATAYDGSNVYVRADGSVDLTAVEPILQYEGTDYSPKGPQNFLDSWQTPMEYTLVNEYGIPRTYYVTIEKDRNSAKPTFTITFNTNCAITMRPVTITKNQTLPRPATPSREGYTFDGWYTESSFRNLYNFNTPVVANFTLHAKWTKIENANTPGPGGTTGSAPGASTTPGTSVAPDVQEEKLQFADVSISDWFYDAVRFVAEQKICNGTSTTTFTPHMQITRGMLATVLYRSEGEPEVSGACSFTDVESGAYYEKAIIWAQNNGIVKGYSDTLFGPDDPVKREQIAAMLYRFAAFLGRDTASEEADIQGYADYDSISAYAVTPLRWTAGSGIMIGKTATTINPQDYATRAELAVILQRFIEGNQ